MDINQTLLHALHRASIDSLSKHTRIPRRSLYSYREGRIDPPLRRAADILSALGYELLIQHRPSASRHSAASRKSSEISPISDALKEELPAETPPQPQKSTDFLMISQNNSPPPAFEPNPDHRITEVLAALADEYEALNDRGRESLLMQFWATHPHLRERAAARPGPRLARLTGE